jgi:preprotein translocase subunit SecG
MLLYYAVTTLHIIVCIVLVLVVLLQSGKGADLAGAFGGGSTQTAFGSRGPASFLSKMTTVAAIIFMLTSISLSMISTRREAKSVLETTKQQTAHPAKKAPATQPAVPPPTPEQIKKRVEELEAKQKQAAGGAGAGSESGKAEKQPVSKQTESPKPAK